MQPWIFTNSQTQILDLASCNLIPFLQSDLIRSYEIREIILSSAIPISCPLGRWTVFRYQNQNKPNHIYSNPIHFSLFCFPHSVCLTTPTRLIVMKFIYARDPFRPSLAILPQTGICHKGYSRWNREEKHTIEKHGMCFAVYLCFCWCRTRHLNWKQSYYFGSVCCPYIPVTAFGRWMKQAPPNYILEGISYLRCFVGKRSLRTRLLWCTSCPDTWKFGLYSQLISY